MGTAGRKVAAAAATGALLAALAACGSGSSTSSENAAKGTAGASASPGTTADAAAGGTGAPSAAAGTGTATPSGDAAGGGAAAGGTPAAGTAGAGAATPGAAAGGSSGGAAGTAGTGSGAAGATTGAATTGGAGGAGQPATGPDSDTALLDSALLALLLPDQKAMTGWEEEKRRVDTADHATTCTAAAPCKGKPLSGSARFASGEVVVRFGVDTLPGRAQAQDRYKEAYGAYADATKYGPADIGLLGTESRAYQGQLAGRDGVAIVLRAGTVVATVTTEGGPVDQAGTRRLAAMLVTRIEQAQAGRTPDAVLG
ncbi:hypothetical protein [Kitasatospora purpeofusca]|uniref:hypothetical protein n=1 Tax=Kitasatospora purpeofusca TaxID=67352 RepID=UPI00225520E5|nr:hypothetical protein [Kitasatospora purpeofusca]MCX4756316.1 hypothetical protein [Kitasatospora purpeofusca]WSR35857.1 hypothetical protein OG715_35835 [Kitasatospora purpeofusca]WSR44166.1 hypothetical protein OG196_36810 [Kitasatospora purpeofusca]